MAILKSMNGANVVLYPMSAKTTNLRPQYLFDVHDWRDPIGRVELRKLSGEDKEVQTFVKEDGRYLTLVDEIILLAEDIILHQKFDFLTIAFRDHHGKWISKALCNLLAKELDDYGYSVYIYPTADCS